MNRPEPGIGVTVPTIDLRGRGPHRFWLFSDVHVGADEFDHHLFYQHLARAEEERWRGVCLGDMFEMVGPGDAVAKYGAMFDQQKPPPAQIDEAVAALERITFDGAVEGNHDWRAARSHGISVWDDVVLPRVRSKRSVAKYLGFLSYLRYVRPDGSQLTFVLSHGEGPVSNPLTTLYRMMLVLPDGDVYAAGHTHDLMTTEVRQEGVRGSEPKLLIRTGTYLKFARYAKQRLLQKPGTPRGSILVTWERDGSVRADHLT